MNSTVTDSFSGIVTQIAIVATLWVLLFNFNMIVFKFSEVIPAVNLVFLPAMLRVTAVLVCRWTGAFGLGLGAFLTMNDEQLNGPGYMLATDIAINIFAPMTSVAVGKLLMKVPDSLDGLTSHHIIMFSILGGLSNGLFHQPLHLMMHHRPTFFDATVTMFVGDMIGCAIMMYAMSFTIRFFGYLGKRA